MIKIKMHQLPGDTCKGDKIAFMENRRGGKRAKAFRRMILERLRAVLKERARKEIQEEC